MELVGSDPAVTEVPVEAVDHHLAKVAPGKNPVPTGAVKVFPAAAFPKINLLAPKSTRAPVKLRL